MLDVPIRKIPPTSYKAQVYQQSIYLRGILSKGSRVTFAMYLIGTTERYVLRREVSESSTIVFISREFEKKPKCLEGKHAKLYLEIESPPN